MSGWMGFRKDRLGGGAVSEGVSERDVVGGGMAEVNEWTSTSDRRMERNDEVGVV